MAALNNSDLTGKVALVTGAAGAIGVAFVDALAAAGASVAAADLPGKSMDDLMQGLPRPECHTSHGVDVTTEESVQKLVDEVVTAHGHLDVIVNSAAILEVYPFLDLPLDSWERTMAVNLRGTFLMCQAAARQMVKQGTGGRIIAVASNVGRIPRMNNASYASSKAAVIHLVRAMAMELAKYQITVNALCPGSTATPMLIGNQAAGDSSKLDGIVKGSIEQWRTGIPLGKLAEPEDQAAMAVFLASEGARHITGQTLCIDGGQTLF